MKQYKNNTCFLHKSSAGSDGFSFSLLAWCRLHLTVIATDILKQVTCGRHLEPTYEAKISLTS